MHTERARDSETFFLRSSTFLSITHCNEFGAALVFLEAYPLWLDIEKIDPDKRDVLESQTTMLEKEGINALSFSYETGLRNDDSL